MQQVSQFMREVPDIFSPSDTASKLLGYLYKTDLYEAPAVGEGKIGLITLRDLLNVVQPEKTKLNTLWRFVEVLSPDRPIQRAVEAMFENDTRAVPIVENGRVVGILSQVEVAKAFSEAQELKEIPVAKIMKHPVITIEKGSKLSSARRLMLDHNISHLPVLDGPNLVGVITAKHIAYHFIIPATGTEPGERIGRSIGRLDGPVDGVMDPKPFTEDPQTTALQTACIFGEEEKTSCVVTGVGREVLGILTPRELVTLLRELLTEEKRLPISIVGLKQEDFLESAAAEEKIRRVIEKNIRFYPPIEEVTVVLDRRNVGGNQTRYEATASIHGPYRQFHTTARSWDLLVLFDELSKELDRALRKKKQELQKSPRQRRIGRPTQRKIGAP
jgi:CBS domain-containing protein/ribosome-associated translation inhibitor RaiA